MEVIPAIDLKNGKCVRLLQGRDEATTKYSDDPAATAAEWVRQGAQRLHVVDLDGAFGRASGNLEILKRIIDRVDATIQFGGGLRSLEDMEEALAAGVDKLVLGTSAIENPGLLASALKKFGAARLIVAIDGLRGQVATRGWKRVSEVKVIDLATQVYGVGVKEILYTDIARDGMMTGPDTATLVNLGAIGLDLLASGGVSDADDVRALIGLRQPKLKGVIIGKALYEKRIDLPLLLSEISPC
jgi:phosphoribosylformimino-5-aminoimidazole carboxamide ribotide isomerase